MTRCHRENAVQPGCLVESEAALPGQDSGAVGRAEPGRSRRGPIAVGALVLAGIAVGLAIRVWIMRTPAIGYLDSDEAVPGLMARHFLHGQVATFYWGQNYGGTVEIGLVALAFLVGGSTALMLSVVPIVLYAVAAVLVWRIGRRTIGMPAAAVAAVLVWVWPSYFVWRSTREYGYYGVLLICALTVVLLALRLHERPSSRDAAFLGAAVGIGWWSSLQIALVAVPALVWLVARRPSVLRYAPPAAAAAVVSALPWILANVGSGWASLRVSPGAVHARSYGFRLGGFFGDALPTAFGLRTPFTLHWLPSRVLGLIALGVLGAAMAVVLARRRRSLELLAAVIVPFPFLYAVSGYTSYRIEPRYLGVLTPLLALVVAAMLADLRVAALALAVASALSVTALVGLRNAGAMSPGAKDVQAPTTVAPLIRVLDRHHITRAAADYWVAFRVTFLTHERIIVAPNSGNRYPPYRELVGESGRTARIFIAGSGAERLQRVELLARGYTRAVAGPYVVYLP